MDHFVCCQCSRSLGGRRYVIRDGRPACVDCFHSLLADYCDACGRIVSVSERHVTLDGRTWHATPTCFRCAGCRQPLLGKPLVRGSERDIGTFFCSVDCKRKHVTDDVTRPRRAKRRSRSVGKNRRKSLGDLDYYEPKTSKLRESVVSLRETSI